MSRHLVQGPPTKQALGAIIPNPFPPLGHLEVIWKLPSGQPLKSRGPLPLLPTGLHDSRPQFSQSSSSARQQHANRIKPHMAAHNDASMG